MNKREQRIAKIAQALLEENLVDNSSSEEDEDFESASVSSDYSQSSSSSAIDLQKYEEIQELTEDSVLQNDEKLMTKQAYIDPAKLKAKGDQQQVSAKTPLIDKQQKRIEKPNTIADAAALLKQKLSGQEKVFEDESTTQFQSEGRPKRRSIKSNFRLTDEEFLNHLAVTYVWNVLSYRDNIKSVQQDTQLQQQMFDEQLHLKTFSTSKPFHSYILTQSRELLFTQILETHFTPKQRKYVLQAIKNKIRLEDFNISAEAKQMPTFLDYKQLFECYWSAYYYQPNDLVQFIEGKYIDRRRAYQQNSNPFAVPGPVVQIKPELTLQQINQNAQKSDILKQIQEKQLLQMQKLQIPKVPMKQDEKLTFNQTKFVTKPTFQSIIPGQTMINRNNEGQFKYIKIKAFPINYEFSNQPNSVLIQTNVSIQNEQQLFDHEDQVKILLTPPKRNQVQKFFVVENNAKSNQLKMHCSLQTDVMAKQLKPNQQNRISPKDYNMNVTIIIDEKEYDLASTDDAMFKVLLATASDIKVLRGKGRAGRRLDDFGELVQKIRPDLIKDGLDKLFIQTRVRTAQVPENDVITYKVEDGEYLTMTGLYKKPGNQTYQVADDPPHAMHLDGNSCKYIVSNGFQLQSQVERWFVLNEEIKLKKHRYEHPVTREGYDSLEEYKVIEQRLKQLDTELLQHIQMDVKSDIAQAQTCIQQQNFSKAGELVKTSFETVLPSYAVHNQIVFDGSRYARKKPVDFVEQFSVLRRFDIIQ